jgi:hypothetical protein
MVFGFRKTATAVVGPEIEEDEDYTWYILFTSRMPNRDRKTTLLTLSGLRFVATTVAPHTLHFTALASYVYRAFAYETSRNSFASKLR